MNHVYDFNQFVVENAISSYKGYLEKNYKASIIIALVESGTLEPETQFVMESVKNNGLYNELWEGILPESFLSSTLNENKFAEWIQDRGKRAMDSIKAGRDKGSEIVKRTADLLKSFGAFASKILEGIKIGLQKVWKLIYGHAVSKFGDKQGKVAEKAVKKLSGKGRVLSNETKNVGDVVKGGVKWTTGGAIEMYSKAVRKAGSEDVKTNESFEDVYGFYDVIVHEAILQSIKNHGVSFINEMEEFNDYSLDESGDHFKIPGISKLVDIMRQLPIVKQLADIEHAAAKATNNSLEALSYKLNKVGAAGGPYKFEVFGILVGIGAEVGVKMSMASLMGGQNENEEISDSNYLNESGGEGMKTLLVKAGISAAILTIMLAIPGAGFIIGIMKTVATYLLYWNLAQVIVKALSNDEDYSEEELSKEIDNQKEENEEAIKNDVEKSKEDKDQEK